MVPRCLMRLNKTSDHTIEFLPDLAIQIGEDTRLIQIEQ